MRGRFRTDLELEEDALRPGAFRLRRRWGARAFSASLVAAGLAATALDAAWGRWWVAGAQAFLSLALLALHVRAELEQWSFDGDAAVRQSFLLGRWRYRVERVQAVHLKQVVVAREGKRACAWLETRAGEQYALVAGSPERVERIAGAFNRAFALAAAEPASRSVH